MTTKTLRELREGDIVSDMHYGLGPVAERFAVVSHVRWREPEASDWTDPGFDGYLSRFELGHYTNKNLVVLGLDEVGGNVVSGYCYDGRYSGLVVLAEKT